MTLNSQTPHDYHGTIMGTVGGTILSTFANLQSIDVIKTMFLATIGAVVSFGMSTGLRWVSNKIRRRSK